MGFLLLLFPFAELYVLVLFGGRFGIVNTLFALVAIGVLGAGLARSQGRYILSQLQASFARGEVPPDAIIHGLLVMIGGILFLIPGFLTDAVGAVFVLPGARHLVAGLLKKRLGQQMKSGSFRVFGFGNFNPGQGPFQRRPTASEPEWMREVSPKVIDIKPVRSDTRPEGEET